MGRNASDDQPGMEMELGADYAFLWVSGGDPEGDLYDERGGFVEHELAQDHQDTRLISERRSGCETAVSGIAESFQEMDFCAELARSAEPFPGALAGADGGVKHFV